VQDSSAVAQEGQKVAESILSFFPGFEAFTLPSPTVDPELMKSINHNKREINPDFFSGLENFKRLLRNVLVPKNSFNDGEIVTGEGEYGRFHELYLFRSIMSTYGYNGRHGSFMGSALAFRVERSGFEPWPGTSCCVLYSQRAFFHPVV